MLLPASPIRAFVTRRRAGVRPRVLLGRHDRVQFVDHGAAAAGIRTVRAQQLEVSFEFYRDPGGNGHGEGTVGLQARITECRRREPPLLVERVGRCRSRGEWTNRAAPRVGPCVQLLDESDRLGCVSNDAI